MRDHDPHTLTLAHTRRRCLRKTRHADATAQDIDAARSFDHCVAHGTALRTDSGAQHAAPEPVKTSQSSAGSGLGGLAAPAWAAAVGDLALKVWSPGLALPDGAIALGAAMPCRASDPSAARRWRAEAGRTRASAPSGAGQQSNNPLIACRAGAAGVSRG